ncbi:MAG: STAS domain-containing protein [Anaerolineales bacterium]|nr:STAS domain-containing protein [Anaerolineales bacterium]
MDISVSKQMGNVEVTVLTLSGELDGQTYQKLIEQAKELYASGARDFLLEMSGLTYVSSAGLVAMHTVALLLRGEALPDTDNGWAAMRSVKKITHEKKQEHIKLLNPRAEIRSVLEMVGFDRAFEIHSDLEEAVSSF